MTTAKKIDEALMQALTTTLFDEIERTKELVKHLIDEPTFAGIVTSIFKSTSYYASLANEFWEMGLEKEGQKVLNDLYRLERLVRSCKPCIGDKLEIDTTKDRHAILKITRPFGDSNIKIIRDVLIIDGQSVVTKLALDRAIMLVVYPVNPQDVLIVGQDASCLMSDTTGSPMLGCVAMSAEKAKEMQEQYENAYGYGEEK